MTHMQRQVTDALKAVEQAAGAYNRDQQVAMVVALIQANAIRETGSDVSKSIDDLATQVGLNRT